MPRIVPVDCGQGDPAGGINHSHVLENGLTGQKSPRVSTNGESSIIVKEEMPDARKLYRASYGKSHL